MKKKYLWSHVQLVFFLYHKHNLNSITWSTKGMNYWTVQILLPVKFSHMVRKFCEISSTLNLNQYLMLHEPSYVFAKPQGHLVQHIPSALSQVVCYNSLSCICRTDVGLPEVLNFWCFTCPWFSNHLLVQLITTKSHCTCKIPGEFGNHLKNTFYISSK